jgi:hypothetical protein
MRFMRCKIASKNQGAGAFFTLKSPGLKLKVKWFMLKPGKSAALA